MKTSFACSICCENFEETHDISAVPCGHTFHNKCLMQWFNTSQTCPQCRVRCTLGKIIKKLYFDTSGDSICDGPDVAKIRNELNTAQCKVKEQEGDFRKMREKVVTSEQKTLQLTSDLKDEKVTNKTLQKQLVYYKTQQKVVDAAKVEAEQATKAMEYLQDVKTIITGCESNVQELVAQYADNLSLNSIKQLSTYVVVLKRELAKCKEERNTHKSTIKDYNFRVLSLKQKIKTKDEKIEELEKDIRSYLARRTPTPRKQGRICSISSSSNSPSLDESVVYLNIKPSKLTYSNSFQKSHSAPRLENHEGSFDLFSPEKATKPSTSSDNASENVCPADQNRNKRARVDEDVAIPEIYNYNILKPKSDQWSVKRVGYDGLGGRSSFIKTAGGLTTKGLPKKTVLRKTEKNQSKLTSLFNHNFS